MDQGFGVVNKAVLSANQLGHLDPSAIWALISLILMSYIVYILKQNKASDKQWQDIRSAEAKSDSSMAEAVSRLADKVSQLQLIVVQQKIGGSNGDPH